MYRPISKYWLSPAKYARTRRNSDSARPPKRRKCRSAWIHPNRTATLTAIGNPSIGRYTNSDRIEGLKGYNALVASRPEKRNGSILSPASENCTPNAHSRTTAMG